MRFLKARDVPGRLAAGAYILHAGWEKWHGTPEYAAAIHGSASGAYPVLRGIEPTKFLRMLAAGELALGTALLTPKVPSKVAGAALTAFSGGLLAMYLRTPAMHKPGSIWPSPAGTAVSKDVWMLGIGLGLVASDATDKRD